MSGMYFKKRFCLLLTAAALFFGPVCQSAQAKGNFYGASEFSAQPMAENLCAITFDDGPSTFTPHLLDMLDEAGIHATFLMLGKNASFYPDTVRRALAEGHEVGNHSYSHPNLRKLSYASIEEQLSKTNDILRSLGADPKVIRPPYGNSNANVEAAAEKLGLKVITWNMDSLDWKRLPDDYSKIPNEWGRPWEPGRAHGVYLFHDIHKRTVDDFPRMLAELKAAGCQRFVTVSDYLDNLFDDHEPVMLMERRHAAPAAVQQTAAQAPAMAATQESSQTSEPAAAVQKAPEAPAEAPQTASAAPAGESAQAAPGAPSEGSQTAQAAPAAAPEQPAAPETAQTAQQAPATSSAAPAETASSESMQTAQSAPAAETAKPDAEAKPDPAFTGKPEPQLRPWAGFAKDPVNILVSQDSHLAVQDLAGQAQPSDAGQGSAN